MPRSVDPSPDHKRRVAALLALLASDEAQRALSSSASRERLAFELTRAWFDEIYVPGSRYLDGLKGDLSDEAVETFRDCFDPVELAAMERFHRFFELRLDMHPRPSFADRRMPVDERWRAVMKDAGYLLQELHVDSRPQHLQDARSSLEALTDVIRIES